MNNLTTIAALPRAGGSMSALPAERLLQDETQTENTGAFRIEADHLYDPGRVVWVGPANHIGDPGRFLPPRIWLDDRLEYEPPAVEPAAPVAIYGTVSTRDAAYAQRAADAGFDVQRSAKGNWWFIEAKEPDVAE